MWGDGVWLLVIAGVIVAAFILGGGIGLQTTPHVIPLWSGAEIKCNDLEASFWLWRMPETARLTIDTDPSQPYPPFYAGGIAQVYVNNLLVKSYDPPLLDKDTIDIVDKLHTGFNKVKAVPKVIWLICNIQTQGLLSGFVEVTYPPGGGGELGDIPLNTILIVAGMAISLIAISYIILRRRG
jgi:hypothetical protein